MPELPEVETAVKGISPHITNQTIKEVIIRCGKLRWPISPQLQNILQGQKILDVKRRAKYLLLSTKIGTVLIHLGMSGHLRILTKNISPKKHDHIDIIFNNNKILRFNDPRKFGAFMWIEGEESLHPLLKNLGPEPLAKEFSGRYLWEKARRRKVAIKSLLMNNRIVTGIGNIYATEALFQAGIFPGARSQTISLEDMQKLVVSVKKILRFAITKGGTTLKDFLDSKGKPGYFANQLKVYGRAGLPCVTCGSPLSLMKIGQRSTVFCKTCQPR